MSRFLILCPWWTRITLVFSNWIGHEHACCFHVLSVYSRLVSHNMFYSLPHTLHQNRLFIPLILARFCILVLPQSGPNPFYLLVYIEANLCIFCDNLFASLYSSKSIDFMSQIHKDYTRKYDKHILGPRLAAIVQLLLYLKLILFWFWVLCVWEGTNLKKHITLCNDENTTLKWLWSTCRKYKVHIHS